MHLLAVSLLTILAGTLLLAKFRKDTPGKLFAIISWFFIAVGFLLFLGAVAGGICKMKNQCSYGKAECRQEMMMKDCNRGMQDCRTGMQGCCCCPQGMGKGMCSGKMECMPKDSSMKCCEKHMEGDSANMPVKTE